MSDVKPNDYYPTYESMYTIYAGIFDRSDLSSYSTQRSSVKKIIIFPQYDSKTFLNDIALLKLNQSIILNNYVQLSCLPNPINQYPSDSNMSAYIVGWGDM